MVVELEQQSSSKLQTIKNNITMEWPEPVVRVQSLSDSGLSSIPTRYIKPESQRPKLDLNEVDTNTNIPVVDLARLFGPTGDLDLGRAEAREVLTSLGDACRDWGFFQIVNHGLSPGLMENVLMTWREFFHLPVEEKVVYANSPKTYEGYGSRLGVQKGAVLDWSDYYYLHHLPLCLMDQRKWPHYPLGCREVIEEYGKEVVKLCERLLRVLSVNLGLKEDFLQSKFGGEDVGACLRVNYYPKCPQPELALGLSSHSDPGGMTVLLPDDRVTGLQVRKGDSWITVKPVKHAFIVNIGDQIQVLSNAIYKSVEHRVVVNSGRERLSLAFFYNPKSNIPIEPAKELVTSESPAMYNPMTFDEYRLFIRMRGPQGKSQVESLKSPR